MPRGKFRDFQKPSAGFWEKDIFDDESYQTLLSVFKETEIDERFYINLLSLMMRLKEEKGWADAMPTSADLVKEIETLESQLNGLSNNLVRSFVFSQQNNPFSKKDNSILKEESKFDLSTGLEKGEFIKKTLQEAIDEALSYLHIYFSDIATKKGRPTELLNQDQAIKSLKEFFDHYSQNFKENKSERQRLFFSWALDKIGFGKRNLDKWIKPRSN